MKLNPVDILPFIGVLGIGFFLIIETRIPQRMWHMSRWKHCFVNLSLSFCNLIIVDTFFVTLLQKSVVFDHLKIINIFELLGLNAFLRIALCIILFDMMMYFWHRLNHKVPLLWRFHRVH
ncbi:MAG: hypothetical protein KC733_04615, partial [Candidatus Omnitrophica bacterium]|nr:hypothetical protein [Candidatus Omnitrophota bacterium]